MPDKINMYACNACGKRFDDYSDAEFCESNHTTTPSELNIVSVFDSGVTRAGFPNIIEVHDVNNSKLNALYAFYNSIEH